MKDVQTNAPIQARQIRVFVSSTFRDMTRERDLLVKEVFPELRRKCSKRFVTFTEVDLRWGITEAQANEGQVLPLCLAEIERSRPYFIGLLGERYGWIPDTFRPEVLAREPWLQEHVQARTSVTELEILHGVLNDPNMHHQAFFYFRDPVYAHDPALTDDERRNMVETDIETDIEKYGRSEANRRTEERKAKLAALKQRIRDSKLPLVEPYADPKALAEIVRNQFDKLIDRLYPEDQAPDPLAQERMAHAAHSRNKLFACIDRPAHLLALNAFVAIHDHKGKGLVVTGESGGGKTALLAAWARDWADNHPEDFLFQHYFGATPESTSPEGFLRRLLGELKGRFGIADDVPSDPEKLRYALPLWLEQTIGKGRIVLVLDGLNQVQGTEQDCHLRFLPPQFPLHVMVFASALPGPQMEALRQLAWSEHDLPKASEAEVDAMVNEYLRIHARTLEPVLRHQLVTAPGARNPLFLRTILEELRQFGSFEQLPQCVGHYLEADNPKDLFLRVVARWQVDFDGQDPEQDKPKIDLVRRALSLLWAARQGLSESEWLDLLGDGSQPLPHTFWAPLFLTLEPHLSQRTGLFAFGHEFLRTAVQSLFLSTEADQRVAHSTLADYFDVQKDFDARKVAELPWHWQEAHAWPALTTLLKNVSFLSSAWNQGYFDIEMYWAAVESNTGVSPHQAYQPLIETPEQLAGTGWQILRLLRDFLSAKEQLKAPLALCDYLICQEQNKGNTDLLRRVLAEKAVLLWGAGDYFMDMKVCQELESLARESADHHRLQIALDGQAQVLEAMGRIDAALAKSGEAETVCRENHNLAGLQAVLGNHATILVNSGKFAEAMDFLLEAEALSRELCLVDGLFASLMKKAQVMVAVATPPALDICAFELCLNEVKDLARRFGRKGELAYALELHRTVLRAKAHYYCDQQDWEAALRLFRSLEWVCWEVTDLQGISREDLECIEDMVRCMVNCAAWRCQQRHQPVEALTLAQEALQFSSKNFMMELTQTCKSLVSVVIDWNDYYRSLALWENMPASIRAFEPKPREPDVKFVFPELGD